jgi:hypothetical protein
VSSTEEDWTGAALNPLFMYLALPLDSALAAAAPLALLAPLLLLLAALVRKAFLLTPTPLNCEALLCAWCSGDMGGSEVCTGAMP